MTIIACDRVAGIMLADSLAVGDDNRVTLGYVKKIFRASDGAIGGSAGGALKAALFNQWLVTGRKGLLEPAIFDGEEGAEGLVLTAKGEILWYVGPIPEQISSNIHAVGYGAPAFNAAVRAGADIRCAIEIACQETRVCGGEIVELRLKTKRRRK